MDTIANLLPRQRFLEIARARSGGTQTPPSSRLAVTVKGLDLFGACQTCGFAPGEPGFVVPDLPYSDPAFGKAIPCPACHDKTMAQRLAECSQLTGWLEFASFDGYKTHAQNQVAKQAALDLCETTAGWLTLWGGYGCGKTHLLASIVNRCVKSQVAAVYYTLPDLLDRLRGSYGDDSFDPLLRRLANVKVLVVDEIDKARPTAWAAEKIYQLFDARYRGIATMATVFAMNRSPEKSGEDIDYMLSRMNDRRHCKIVEVGGGDVRPLDVT